MAPGAPRSPFSPCDPMGPASPWAPVGPDGPISPLGPAGPCKPSPCVPCGPCSPCCPMSPCSPRGPCSPCGPTSPGDPGGPAHAATKSRVTMAISNAFINKSLSSLGICLPSRLAVSVVERSLAPMDTWRTRSEYGNNAPFTSGLSYARRIRLSSFDPTAVSPSQRARTYPSATGWPCPWEPAWSDRNGFGSAHVRFNCRGASPSFLRWDVKVVGRQASCGQRWTVPALLATSIALRAART